MPGDRDRPGGVVRFGLPRSFWEDNGQQGEVYEESGRRYISGSVCLFSCWRRRRSSADAVITWNENAAKAATAACLHISGNGLAEARMYAMVHAAVHDAVNAIDRRSRPYAFDATSSGPASVDAAVAAAARDVLVSVIATLPESPECVANGIANANALYAAALAAIPRRAGEDERRGAGSGRRGRHHRAAGRRRVRCAVVGSRLPAGDGAR